MQRNDKILDKIIHSDETCAKKDILDLILPIKNDKANLFYSWQEVESALEQFHSEIETVQRESNDEFVEILDSSVQVRFRDLTDSLNKTQQDVLQLHCNIAQAKEQYENFVVLCNDKVILDRREMIQTEQSLRKSLQESKFKQIREFYKQFIIHLDASAMTCRQLLSYNASNLSPIFDWTQYHQTIYLLRACGKAMIDVDKFERLYQFFTDFVCLTFKQPISKMDLNNFIEFPTTYSMETQLDIIVNNNGEQIQKSYARFMSDLKIDEIIHSAESVEHQLFKETMSRLTSITIDCCRLLVDLNSNYIEAHFTNCINIDKLNGLETAGQKQSDQPTLPSYAFAPQDSITQIGQHILNLRKQTEPFDQIDSRPIKLALEYLHVADHTGDKVNVRECRKVTEIILQCVAHRCIRSFVGRATKSVIAQLTPNGKKQLQTDAAYLRCILDDLGLIDRTKPTSASQRFLQLVDN